MAILQTNDSIFNDYIYSIEKEIDSLLFEEMGQLSKGQQLKKESGNNETMIMMEVFNQC